ncbi:MAG: D-isomer specific 2-hydroxyacid dehydrogenase NAD-binding protein [Planctomycetaceae bacterium]|nr:D-isomer specific 2-hydroxyacid dehydrogenase NAD-binding protein [Planctomycetaceae bacterium]
MFKAVRLNSSTYPVSDEERAELARADVELIEIEGQEEGEILAAAEDCDALLVISSRVPSTLIKQMSRCRVIARYGAGTDKVDIPEATRRGILVTNVPDFCLHEQAEHTMTLLLAFARRLPYMMQAMATFDWSARHHSEVHRVRGRTLGLVGLGASAQEVAKRAAAFGLHLLTWVRNPAKYQSLAEALNVKLVSLEELMTESDFVSIHLPLCTETYHLLSAELLATMKPTAVLINTARGAIVDEQALVRLLQSRSIGGAALDVFEEIDVFALPGTPAVHPLLGLDNVILTPHCAGSSVESSLDSKIRGARNAADVLLGIRPRHIVNSDVVPSFPLRAL